MQRTPARSATPDPAGLVIHGADRYDMLVWFFTLGGEQRLRQRMLRPAQLQLGETVLDIGCGTGTLAILAKRQVGAAGAVFGVDPSPEMIARATQKARRAKVDISFKEGAVQALPFGDAEIDVVLSTLMLHHLPRKARPAIMREIKRVLKPGGRFLAVDFIKPAATRRGLTDRMHRHGFIAFEDITAELESAGFTMLSNGPIGERDLEFVLAASGAPKGDVQLVQPGAGQAHDSAPTGRSRALLLIGGGAALALIAAHAGAALTLPRLPLEIPTGPASYLIAAGIVLLVVLKVGLLGFAHSRLAGLLSRWLGAREERIK